MKPRNRLVLGMALLLAASLLGCSRARSDQELASEVQTKIHADAALAAAPIQVQCNNGVVVLSGKVETDFARSQAENVAKLVEGVHGVVNNLEIAAAAAPTRPANLPAEAAAAKRPAERPAQRARPAPAMPMQPAQTQTAAAPAGVAEPARVTIPAGTAMTVRLIDPVDSEKNKEGDTFRASLNAPIVVDEKTVIPKGADAEARLVSAKSAGHFTGQSELVLVLSKVVVGKTAYEVQTGALTKQGASRGKRSAAMIGGGAAAGAVIGAIVGGGKGAAIGAAAGAGTGTGVQAITKGQQVKLPSETLLEFELTAPLMVVPAPGSEKRETVG